MRQTIAGPPNGLRRDARRATPLVAAVVLAASVVLAACGGASGGGGGTAASHTDIKLATITASTTQNAFQEMAEGSRPRPTGRREPDRAGAERDHPGERGPDVQAATRTSPDGIAYMSTAPDVFVHPTSQATSQGIAVVAMDAAPLPGRGVTTLIANDNVALGAAVATELIKKIPRTRRARS